MISHEKKFIFIHVPRTGGTSLSHLLRPYCDEESLAFSPFGEEGNLHAAVLEYVKFYGERILDYTLVSIVRNPWERALSLSVHHNNGLFDRACFRDLIFRPNEVGFWPHSHFVFLAREERTLHDGTPAVYIEFKSQYSREGMKYMQKHLFFPYFIKFENYAIETARLLTKLEIPYKMEDLVKKTNHTTHEHYSHYYQDDEKNHIAKMCAFDLQMFGYTFDDRREK